MGRDYLIGHVKSRLAAGVSLPRSAPSRPRGRPSPPLRARPRDHPPQHLTHFEGGNALSGFRAQALLAATASRRAARRPACRRAMCTGCTDASRSRAETQDRLEALLRYGDPYAGSVRRHAASWSRRGWARSRPGPPRRPTSPTTAASPFSGSSGSPSTGWTSSGGLLGGGKPLTERRVAGLRRAAARPHDRERAARAATTPHTCSMSSPASRWSRSTCWGAGARRWWQANTEFGLALSRRRDRLPGRRLHRAWRATPPTSS